MSTANYDFVQQNMTNGAHYVSFEVEWHGNHVQSCVQSGSSCENDVYGLPVSLMEWLLPTQTNDVKLSMTRGLWRQELWGNKPIADGATGAGALLQASFSVDNSKSRVSVGRRWRQLKASIGGTVCGALNDNNIRSSPFVQRNKAWMSSSQEKNCTIVMQYFPAETVCTENVRAWAKWWTDSDPFYHDKGLTHVWMHSLDWILHSPWYSLSVQVTNTPNNHNDTHGDSSTTISPTSSSNLYAILRISAVLPPSQRQLEVHENLLERIIAWNSKHDEAPSSQSKSSSSSSSSSSTLSLSSNRTVRDVGMHYSVLLRRDLRDSRRDYFTANTSITISPLPLGVNGTGTALEASCWTVTITETLPNFYDLILHSYQYVIHSEKKYVADLWSFSRSLGSWSDRECFGSNTEGDDRYGSLSSSTLTRNDPWHTYRARRCLGTLTWSLDIHRMVNDTPVVLYATFTAQKRHLHRETYPADASRGLDIPPVFVTVQRCQPFSQRHTEIPLFLVSDPVLLTMPIPDGSMPFNIITLVSSVLAFLVGSLINALVRQKTSTTSGVAAIAPSTTVTAPKIEEESTETIASKKLT